MSTTLTAPTIGLNIDSDAEPYDVYLGRGNAVAQNSGNRIYRSTIKKYKTRYFEAKGHQAKGNIAKNVIKLFLQNGGTFYYRKDDKQITWEKARMEIVLKKVKQALREKGLKKKKKNKKDKISAPPATSIDEEKKDDQDYDSTKEKAEGKDIIVHHRDYTDHEGDKEKNWMELEEENENENENENAGGTKIPTDLFSTPSHPRSSFPLSPSHHFIPHHQFNNTFSVPVGTTRGVRDFASRPHPSCYQPQHQTVIPQQPMMVDGALTSPSIYNSPMPSTTKLVSEKNHDGATAGATTGASSSSNILLPYPSNQDHHVYHHFTHQQIPGVTTGASPHLLYDTATAHDFAPSTSTFPYHTTRVIHHFVPQCPTWLDQSDAVETLRSSGMHPSAQRNYIQLPDQAGEGGVMFPQNNNDGVTTHIHVYPSKLAVLAANRIEIKQEHNTGQYTHNRSCHASAAELPSPSNASVSGEGNNVEYQKRSSLYRQQDDRTKKLTLDQIVNIASTDEIIGLDDDDSNHAQKSSVYFLSSFLLSSSSVKRTFRHMMDSQSSESSRSNVVNLLTLERNSIKWYGNKIPYAFFSFCLPEKIVKWTRDIAGDNFRGKVEEDWIKDADIGFKRRKVHQALNEKLANEINLLKHSLYSLSEQVKSDLGLMCPRVFIKARSDAIAKGLMKDHRKDNVLIILDDDSSSTIDDEA